MQAAVRAQDILNKKAPAYSLSKRHCAGRDRNGAEKLGAFVCRGGVLLAVCTGLWHGAGQWAAAAKPGGAGGCSAGFGNADDGICSESKSESTVKY